MSVQVVVFGSTGFIGSAVLRRLSDADVSPSIYCIKRPSSSLTPIAYIEREAVDIHRGATFIVSAGVKKQYGDHIHTFQENINIACMVSKFISIAKPSRVIFISTAGVYGEGTTQGVLKEVSITNPNNYYGFSKLASEWIIEKACKLNEVKSLISLRPPLVYGHGDSTLSYGPTGLVYSAIREKQMVLWGDGRERREFVYIDDMAYIIVEMLNIDFFGPLNVATGQSRSFREISQIIQSHIPEARTYNRTRTAKSFDFDLNGSELRKLLPDDFNFISLEEGIARMINEYK